VFSGFNKSSAGLAVSGLATGSNKKKNHNLSRDPVDAGRRQHIVTFPLCSA
jgi:hypothetical protein